MAQLRRRHRDQDRWSNEDRVVTFRHHPKSVLLGRAPRTLTSLDHRLELFRRAQISRTVVLTFDEDLRRIPAEVFARDFLARKLERGGGEGVLEGLRLRSADDRRGDAFVQVPCERDLAARMAIRRDAGDHAVQFLDFRAELRRQA